MLECMILQLHTQKVQFEHFPFFNIKNNSKNWGLVRFGGSGGYDHHLHLFTWPNLPTLRAKERDTWHQVVSTATLC